MNTTGNQFSAEELKKIDEADDLHIAPFRADGKTYGTPTWVWEVVLDGELYVRAYNGVYSQWYNAAILQQAGRIIATNKTYEVSFESVTGAVNEAIDEAYKVKYAGSPYLEAMISNRAKKATIKIVKRD